MKLQGMGIVFALIALPIILVLSYYIQMQVNTIALQTSYDTKLLDATHDAMAAFEINTANEDLSSVADSLRSIITASNNIFINTLSTNLGMSNASKSFVQPYVPAILYTLYDGYYIYSPTKKPIVCVNTEGIAVSVGDKGVTRVGNNYQYDKESTADYSGTIGSDYGQLLYKIAGENLYSTELDDNTEYVIDYVLKSYIPYSARYDGVSNGNDVDITINYTLDNYITVFGTIGSEDSRVYYSKSGYLIDRNLVQIVSATNLPINLEEYNEKDAQAICLSDEHDVTITLNGTTTITTADDRETVAYYVGAKIFSEWVYENLSGIVEEDIRESFDEDAYNVMSEVDEIRYIYNFDGRGETIFNDTEDPENDDSVFGNHKSEIIKNSIKYNLNLAMSSYNTMSNNLFSFNMPVISETEWDQIINSVSVVSFMQGFRCGLKTYNNYAIVSSTNNELTVIPEEIFYVSGSLNDEVSSYHRIDCPDLLETADETASGLVISSFKSKAVKYDKILNPNTTPQYVYDHKNLACYNCIIGNNYVKELESSGIEGYHFGIDIDNLSDARKKAYYIGVGKERNNLYKMNAIKESQGYEIPVSVASLKTDKTENILLPINRNTEDIKAVQIIISNTKCNNPTYATVKFNVSVGSMAPVEKTISLNQKNKQTINVDVNVISGAGSVDLKMVRISPSDDNVEYTIESVKVIYK